VGAFLQIEIEYVKNLYVTRKKNEFFLSEQKTGEIWKINQLKGKKKESKFWGLLRKWRGKQRIKSVTEEVIEERNHVSNVHPWKRI